jgi:5-methylcytosine-specific restriction protein B
VIVLTARGHYDLPPMSATPTPQSRRLGQSAVDEAIRCLGKLKLKPKADSMLRVLLGFSALRKGHPPDYEPSGSDLRNTVADLFQIVDSPQKEFPGTISLRGSGGSPVWLTNDAYRGSWMDYAGPNKPGRILFDDQDWRKPLRSDAVSTVAAAKGKADTWPPRDVFAALIFRNTEFDPSSSWDDVIEAARNKVGLSSDDFEMITSDPALTIGPFEGPEWSPDNLPKDLRPASASTVAQSEKTLDELPEHVQYEVRRVLDALRRHGESAIVALAGVPGTSKSYVARIAARAYAAPDCLVEIQFSPGYTYEEFIEGPRFASGGKLETFDGVFRLFNQKALDNPDKQFVLLIEELSRADLPRVLGELLTYLEYRGDDDVFTTMYQREGKMRVAPNLALLATYNPTDRSAVSIDAAIIRRMRVLSFPPRTALLREMLTDAGVDTAAIDKLVELFDACRDAATPDRFDEAMPFGHAIFHDVRGEEDLHALWWEQLRPVLIRPRTPQHELYETIRDHYPWHVNPDYRLPSAAHLDDAEETGEAAVQPEPPGEPTT